MLFSSFFITTAIFVFLPGYSSSCSENEVDTDCVNPCNTCEQKGRCDPPPTCQPGCDCKPGFFRDESGFCLPEEQCQAKPENPKCPKNALFLPCAPPALPTCESPDSDPDYEDECFPGCVCRPGLLKRNDGQCVTPDQCHAREDHGKETPDACREEEEYYDCTPSCKNTCENINNPAVKCQCGPPGCFCRDGLVKAPDGKCIPPKHCPRLPSSNDPEPKCPKNAIFIECGSPCPPTCDDLRPQPCEEKCITACYCKPSYLKRKDGVCVRPMECQPRKKQEKPAPKCPDNAVFIECGSPCPPTCEDRLPVCEEKCVKACYCKPGFLLKTDEAKCVKPEHCSNTSHPSVKPQPTCATDEQFFECTPICKNTCENIYNPEAKCKCGPPGCFCKEGLVKGEDGKCILPEQCEAMPQPECSADEQFYDCTPSCRNTCENFKNSAARCYCGPPGCFCKEGLVKRADGKCVPPNQCRATPQPECSADEQFYECTPSCRNTCENFRNPAAACYCGPPGCFCKEGLIKRADGKCVPPNQCHATPQPECSADEQFYDCTPSCRNTCENFRNPAAACYCGPPGCFCKEGLVKRADGKCVPPNQCHAMPQPECSADEQFYECTPSCRNTCENFRNPAARCYCGPAGCFCREGLVKRADGKCVPPNQCRVKPQPVCGRDEQFYECKPSCKNTCSHFFKHGVQCRCAPPGCFCKKGLVKRSDGKCVPPSECPDLPQPQCGEDQKFYNCTPSCKNTCENFFNPAIRCGCGPPGCFCKDGLVKSTDGKCIQPDKCQRCQRPGEEFQECGSTCPDTCENRGRRPPRGCSYLCKRGCFCRKGLYRAKSGHCVTLKDCDTARNFATTSKPKTKREDTGALPVTVPDDCHGCPTTAECAAYCKSLGNFIGLCTGENRLHCRCI